MNPEIIQEIMRHKDLPNRSPFSEYQPRIGKSTKEIPEPMVCVENVESDKPHFSGRSEKIMLHAPDLETPYLFENQMPATSANKENVAPPVQLPPVEVLMSESARAFVRFHIFL